jgi:hypothetical protein
MNFPVIRKCLAGFLRNMQAGKVAYFVDGKDDSVAPATPADSPDNTPFVLVAHRPGGQWEVYAKDYEHPLASFDERQACCDFACNLAKTRQNAIILIRDKRGFQ